MKFLSILLLGCLSVVWAQSSQAPAVPGLPDLPDEAVIATFPDGANFTMGQLRGLYPALPPAMQQAVLANRQEFLNEYSLMRRLTKMAEAAKLDQQTPYKEGLEFQRLMVLSQAQLMDLHNSTVVEPADVVKYYDSNKEKFKQVKVKAIYVAFVSDAAAANSTGKRLLTEPQAKAKAAKLLEDIRAGADFVKLVKENSDDETSRSKDGDFATMTPNENVPDAVRAAVFALKQGEVTEPVRQSSGYYLFRAEEVKYRPLSQAREDIFEQLKQQQMAVQMDKINNETKVKNVNPAFMAPAATPKGK